jgi:hypothetical protein
MAASVSRESEPPKTAGDRLRSARLAAGYLDPKSFAASFDLDLPVYLDHEEGRTQIEASDALHYAHLLGNCLVGWLLAGSGLKPSFVVSLTAAEGDILNRRRFTVARKAFWSDAAQAAQMLGVTPSELLDMEEGRLKIDDAAILRFCGLTHCPREWITAGSVDRMEPAFLCRIALLAPELLPRLHGDLASHRQGATPLPIGLTFKPGETSA